MYTTPATTVGLASSAGASLPLITGGCQCHTWLTEAEFDVVKAVALLTELCCGPCRYWGQSRFGAARAALADPAAGASAAPARANAAIGSVARHRGPVCDIMGSFAFGMFGHVHHMCLSRVTLFGHSGGSMKAVLVAVSAAAFAVLTLSPAAQAAAGGPT